MFKNIMGNGYLYISLGMAFLVVGIMSISSLFFLPLPLIYRFLIMLWAYVALYFGTVFFLDGLKSYINNLYSNEKTSK